MEQHNKAPWETLISAGIAAQEQMDSGRWVIGDLALTVQADYGQDTIGKFAKEIAVELASVRAYRTVSAYWHRENSTRIELLESCPMLKWSHFREAMRIKDQSKADQLLREANDKALSIEAFRLTVMSEIGKPLPPKKLLDVETMITDMRSNCRVVFELNPELYTKLIEPWRNGQSIRLAIWIAGCDANGNPQ